MLLINLMVALASGMFYMVFSQYYTLGTGGAFLLSLFVFILANGPQFIKVQIYRKESPALINKIWGTILVIFILGLSYRNFINLWLKSIAEDDLILKIFLVWSVLVAAFMVAVPLIKVTKIDKEIADTIKETLS